MWLARPIVPDGKEVEEDRKAAIYKCCLCVALQQPLRLHKHADIHSKSPASDN